LTRGPTHPSLLHYHIALRRLGKAISSDKHRGHVATLAATLLLGYYETMAAEHDKWSSHIHGAKQLLKEIDFARLARRVELMEKEESLGEHANHEPSPPPSLLRLRKMRKQSVINEVDDNMAAYMMGKTKRRPNPFGRRVSDAPFSRKEIETMQLQEDMFWWFAKMDCYQSVLSGCPLVYGSLSFFFPFSCRLIANYHLSAADLIMSFGVSVHQELELVLWEPLMAHLIISFY
jgi:Fungal specific transcription factor domain